MSQADNLDPIEGESGDDRCWILRENRKRGWGERPECPTVFMGPVFSVERAKGLVKDLNELWNGNGVFYRLCVEVEVSQGRSEAESGTGAEGEDKERPLTQ